MFQFKDDFSFCWEKTWKTCFFLKKKSCPQDHVKCLRYLQAKFKISEEQLLSYEQSEKHKNFGQLRVNENIQPMRITVKEAPLNITADVYHEYLYNFMDLVEHFNSAKDRTTQNV